MPNMASKCMAYFLWMIGGYFGLHHFYLKRDKQAFIWWCLPGGYFGAGWIRDFWRIPEYVADANNDQEYVKKLTDKMRASDTPPSKMARWLGMLVVGNMFGMLIAMAVPEKDELGIDLSLLAKCLVPLGCAFGVWLVGNIGREQGTFLRPLLACYATLPLHFYGGNMIAWTTIVGALLFKRQWRRQVRDPAPMWKRILILSLCGSLYVSMWGSYLYFNATVVHNGEKIKLRDAVTHFIKSPAVKEFSKNLLGLWEHMKAQGFWSTWSQLVASLDPTGEKNALKVMELKNGASQEEIRSRYRELTKQWHPDRVKDPELKEEAHEKFREIQEAYEILSELKKKRAKQNIKVGETEQDRTEF